MLHVLKQDYELTTLQCLCGKRNKLDYEALAKLGLIFTNLEKKSNYILDW